MKLNKKNKDEEFWPRLLLDKKQEKTNVTVDWDRYVDEDEAHGKDFDMSNLDGGMDFGGMGGMDFGSMGGMPDEDEDEPAPDSDDDADLPDLESTEDAEKK